MSRRSKAAEHGAGDVELHYTITPRLVSSLGLARWTAGRASVLGLSFYGLRALQTEIMRLRIAEMTVASGFNVTMKDVERVVAGDLLPPLALAQRVPRPGATTHRKNPALQVQSRTREIVSLTPRPRALRARMMLLQSITLSDGRHPLFPIDYRDRAHLLRRITGNAVAFTATPAPAPMHVSMDASQFDQVVMNLVANARDATPPGGSVSVRLEEASAGVARQALTGQQAEG